MAARVGEAKSLWLSGPPDRRTGHALGTGILHQQGREGREGRHHDPEGAGLEQEQAQGQIDHYHRRVNQGRAPQGGRDLAASSKCPQQGQAQQNEVGPRRYGERVQQSPHRGEVARRCHVMGSQRESVHCRPHGRGQRDEDRPQQTAAPLALPGEKGEQHRSEQDMLVPQEPGGQRGQQQGRELALHHQAQAQGEEIKCI